MYVARPGVRQIPEGQNGVEELLRRTREKFSVIVYEVNGMPPIMLANPAAEITCFALLAFPLLLLPRTDVAVLDLKSEAAHDRAHHQACDH